MATITYDPLFQKYAARFFLAVQIDGKPFDWRWLKAQAMAESGLNPRAHSPAGAMGLMQLMPRTAAECAQVLGIPNKPWDPESNVCCGAWYLSRMWSIFEAERGLERLRSALAAYNAGARNIIRAQAVAADQELPTDKWASIAAALPAVTGHHASETCGYVRRIERLYKGLVEVF